MMKRLLIACFALLPVVVIAAGAGNVHLQPMEPNLNDKASLQNGVKTYMNYCMGCHSLKYQRYERTADDLGIPHQEFLDNLVFDRKLRIGALMENAMATKKARRWFGAAPPDLSLVTRLRGGPEWVYTYLKTFYIDESRPMGVNNLVFENVGMPHALIQLQGRQVKSSEDTDTGDHALTLVPGTGQLSAEEYDKVVYDLVNFLHYVGDPSRLERESLGVYVLIFLAFFFVFTFLLNREYWKDVH